MLQLYITNKNYSSWSLRAWVLMRGLGIEFVERLVPLGSPGGEQAFAAFSPSGRVPCLVDGATTVWDSLAIAEYLAEQHPKVWPREKEARAWARCASAEMHSGFHRIRDVCTMNCGLRVRLHPPSQALLAEWERIDRLWNEGLERFGGPFLCGVRFCAVDAFFAPVAFRIQTYSPALSRPAAEYAQRLLSLPSMQEWYAAAIAETSRDEPHEAEARAAGVWIADLRATA